MSIALAATWQPRGETLRFRRLYPFLARLYDHLIVVMPPNTHAGMVLSFRIYDKLSVVVADEWAAGRYIALQQGVETGDTYIHYADLDRLIRWGETKPSELTVVVEQVQHHECLVLGRDEDAYATHPRALVETEAISNQVFSHLLGINLDISAGSKGFSRDVAEFILKNSVPGNAFGTDAEWIVLARRGGFDLTDFRVSGLDWESADRYSIEAATEEQQARAAAKYDADPKHWRRRVAVADEIVKAGIGALKRELN